MSDLKEKCLLEFLSKDPYSRMRKVAKYSIFDMLRALNWAASGKLMDAFYELGLDKTLARPRSPTEIAHEHYIVDVRLLWEFLDTLVHMGILDEAAGRYKLRFFKKKIKKPSVVDEFMRTPLKAVFEVVDMMGENVVDVLMTGERELDWVKDAAIAFEPLEFSPQMVMMRLNACEIIHNYLKDVLWVEGDRGMRILIMGLASGYGVINVAQYFREIGSTIIALDFSEREINLARGLLEDFNLEVWVDKYDIFKDLLRAKVVRDVLDGRKFSACIAFERWRFFDKIQRSQLVTNIAYSLEIYGCLGEFSIVKEEARAFNTVLYTIRGWSGYMDVNEKRGSLCIAFQRLKERMKKMIVRADLPLVRGVWL